MPKLLSNGGISLLMRSVLIVSSLNENHFQVYFLILTRNGKFQLWVAHIIAKYNVLERQDVLIAVVLSNKNIS